MRKLRITIGNKSYDVTVEDLTEAGSYPPSPTPGSQNRIPTAPAIPLPSAAPVQSPQSSAAGTVTSPMAGAIKSILVEAGASVLTGQPLIILEAMKMENQITAPVAGTVQRIDVKEGDSVRESQVLLVLEQAMLLAQQDQRPLIDFTLAPLFEDYGIPLAVMGVLVVFVALVLIAVFIKLLPKIFARDSASAPEPPAAGQHLRGEELAAETLVVIAAAVAETIRQPHRIVRIRGLTSEDFEWSLEGRMQHHQSHKIQRRDHR